MLIIVKSSPETPEGKRGIKLAIDMTANVVLIQNGVYFALKNKLNGFMGIIYVLEDDIILRGLRDEEIEKNIKKLDYDGLVELMIKENKVIGTF
ncbi:MAG: sulfurtransferase complex subunit TusB [Nitrospirae bacterium]|nr:sulfurtransferase complex subunit TusB [Nitrospirota bacterium]